MENTTDLISTLDIFLFVLYAFLGYYFMKYVVFKKMQPVFYKLVAVSFIFKLIGCVLMSLLIVYYWKVSDNLLFYADSKSLFNLIRSDIINFKYFFLPVDAFNEKIKMDISLSNSKVSGLESNFLVTRFCTVFYPLALGKYLLINFFFCLLATIGELKLYLALSEKYSHIKRGIAISVLFMPSVILYSSYINKETLCMAFIGFAVYNYFKIVNKKDKRIYVAGLVINILLLYMLKVYIVYAFIGGLFLNLLLTIFLRYINGSIISKLFTVIITAALFIIFMLNIKIFDPYVVGLIDTSNFFQQQYNSDFGETSSFEFGQIETSFQGLLKKTPFAFYTTYFRPHLWEVNKPIILFSALESLVILFFLLSAIFKKITFLNRFFTGDSFIRIMVLYTVLFGITVGLSTFNFGTLIRYKIPAVPFLMLFIFLLSAYQPAKKIN